MGRGSLLPATAPRLGAILVGAAILLGGGAPGPAAAVAQGFGANGVISAHCGGLGDGTTSCLFRAQAVPPGPTSPSTITIAVSSPSGVTIVGAYGADPAGDTCNVTAGGGTATVALTCPAGLQDPATASLTVVPAGRDVQGSVTYGGLAADVGGAGGERWVFTLPGRPPAVPDFPVPPQSSGAPLGRTLPAYSPGWNLTGGGSGWNLFRALDVPGAIGFRSVPGPFFTYQAGDTSYETISDGVPLPAGVGVWAYFSEPVVMRGWSGLGTLDPLSVPLPAGQWVMIADTGDGPQTLSGADAVFTYDTGTGSYTEMAILQPGQGAWAFSARGGVVTMRSVCPGQPCPQSTEP